MPYFVGEKLSPPKLRFSASSVSQWDYSPRRGLQNYGPYDAMTFGKDRINCLVVYPATLQSTKQIVVSGLQNGNGSFAGFQKLFRLPFTVCSERSISAEIPEQIDTNLRLWVRDTNPDIVLLLTSTQNPSFYTSAKSILIGLGVPSQFATQEKLRNSSQLPWMLENIALQMYAKVGGTPWTVLSPQKQKSLVVGISRAEDKQKQRVVGFVTLFSSDGDYLFFSSIAPQSVYWKDRSAYQEALAGVIAKAYNEYANLNGNPDEIVIHLCKKPGKFREFFAAEQAMKKLGANIPYAILHLNGYSSYRLFDSAHSSYVPQSGIKVVLSETETLLFLDGRKRDFRTSEEVRNRKGVPRLFEIHFDPRSTISPSEFPRLVRQVFDFAGVNWRGFNAQSVPATLNYSALIAKLIAEIGVENWRQHVAQLGLLADKAWFL
ncbi:hypothetical protein SE15_06660 [Thermanaerothrix daxensis]|uniref:Protein argonaute n=1 Tax=Thermanaerothrix daxensis TaxID=869279 RepID=A0A0N8GQU9_9CHLR|nr:Piwi domain-containing protein [Thermanaerothrix daxensis]KPL84706.1 hypothetical protein SE15_06660 [Thermanaerothrix daxensis]